MPVWLDGVQAGHAGLPWIGDAAGVALVGRDPARQDCLEIGLVNNMPDAALQATERQFVGLIAAAAGRDIAVRMQFLSLPRVARGAAAAVHIRDCYADIHELGQTPLDALIVTGAEPVAVQLTDEPYWDDLARLIDWAEHNTISTLWSCLAAHAAVLHLDGVARRRLPRKRSGVFGCDVVTTHPLVADAPSRLDVSHSRWNDLAEDDLLAHGYDVLTRSPVAGVDVFVKRWKSLFVFFQGHPEYDVESIALEYRRDLSRYLRGERSDYPSMPKSYFDEETEAAFGLMERRAVDDRAGVGLRDLPRRIALRPGLADSWQASVVPMMRNWLEALAAARR